MKRILNTALLSSFAAMLFTGVAAAQSAVPTLTFIGSGCPLDADSVNSHWEGSTLVVNFAQMSATKGPGVSLLEGRKTCSLTLDLKVPNGLKYTLVGYTASGYDSLAEGDKRNLSVSSFFQGSSDTATFTNESLGAKEGEFRVRERALSEDFVWSPCNAQRAQTINTAVRVNGSDRQAAGFSTLEGLRLHFRLGLCDSSRSLGQPDDEQLSTEITALSL